MFSAAARARKSSATRPVLSETELYGDQQRDNAS
jgi:hypothetical protein